MTEDVYASSRCPWLKFPQLCELRKFLLMRQCGLCVIAFLVSVQLHFSPLLAQYAAFNSTAINSFQSELTWATGISTYDINHDGWDDITAATSQHGVAIYLNTHGDFEYIDALENVEGNLKTIYWADYDNDSDADILIIRYTANPILLRNEGNWSFTDVTAALPIPIYSPLMQSACWADYDNDGFLDLYINNYYLQNDITNWLFHNNGDGTFTELAAVAGVDNGSQPTYQSTWIDVDRDGDQDLYVSNDRDEGNQLFYNTGEGYFTADTTLAINPIMDAMGVHWHDHDLDGDFDVYITNEIEPSLLIENRQGHFVDVTDSLQVGCSNHVSWGVQWTDPDNNGLSDLIVIHKDFNNITCHFKRNEDMSYFIHPSSILSQQPYPSYCLVTGDFNNDGHEDLVQGTVSPQRILVWLADTTSNNSISIRLQGVISNHDGIGAIIEVHSGNKQLIKQVTCGESYYGQCSQQEIFGIGNASNVDSVLIYWPSGWTDVLYNIPANERVLINEGLTYIDSPDTLLIQRCFDEDVQLEPEASFGVLWENGDTLTTRVVAEPGHYSCTIPGPFNQPHQITFHVIDFAPELVYSTSPIQCTNSHTGVISVQLTDGIDSIVWNTGSNSFTLVNAAPGLSTAEIFFTNGCHTSLEVILENPDPMQPWIWSDTICANSTTALIYTSVGGTGLHSWNWLGADPNVMTAGNHNYSITDQAGCIFEGEYTVNQFEKPTLSWQPPIVCSGNYVSSEVLSLENITIEWDEPEEPTLFEAGIYNFSYTSGDGCWYDTVFVVTEHPEIHVSIETSDSLLTNGDPLFYAEVEGGNAPFSFLWNTGDTSVFTQNNGELFISCLVTDSAGCEVQETIWLSNTSLNPSIAFGIYPNPAKEFIQVAGAPKQPWKIRDASARLVAEGTINECVEKININGFNSGIYFLSVGEKHMSFLKNE